MPIVTIECVVGESSKKYDASKTQSLSDKLGRVFGSEPGTTWIKLHYLDQANYAENDAELDKTALPTFVNVLLRSLPDEDQLAITAQHIATCVSESLVRLKENIHVIFEPEGFGRVAFGGVLLKKPNQKNDT